MTDKYNIPPSLVGLELVVPDMPVGGGIVVSWRVERCSVIKLNQETEGQEVFLPDPSDVESVHVLDVVNCGPASIAIHGANLSQNNHVRLIFLGMAWVVSGEVSNHTEGEKVASSVLTVDFTNGSVKADARLSTYDGDAVGGQLGRHNYSITTQRNYLDITSAITDVPLIAGANVEMDGDGDFLKANEGNSWNSSAKSAGALGDPNTEDFAVTWVVESITGTIREMGGLDDNPAANNSYNSGEHFIYQVNGALLYFYEKGANKARYDIQLAVGDKLGVRVESGVATYFHMRGAVVTDMYTSLTPVISPMHFKAAFNRGSTSSGRSEMGGVQVHKGLELRSITRTIEGAATEILRSEDLTKLAEVGLNADVDSTYSLINSARPETLYFPAGTAHEFTHGYSVSTAQSIASI